MSENTYDPADPHLTAYVLGELDDAEVQAVEQQMEQCAETRTAVEEIRETVGMVTSALAAEPTAVLTDEQRTAITDEAAAPVSVQHARHATWRGKAASFTAGVVATAVIILSVLPQFHRGMDDMDGRQMVRNDENTVIATTTGGQKQGDMDVSYAVEPGLSGQQGQNVLGPSLSAAEHVGQSSTERQRWGERNGQGQGQRTAPTAGNGEVALEVAESSITTDLGTIARPHRTGEAMTAGNPSQNVVGGRLIDGWDPNRSIKLGMARGYSHGRMGFFDLPDPNGTSKQGGSPAGGTIAGLAAPGYRTQFGRSKTRMPGNEVLERGPRYANVAQPPLGWRQVQLEWDDGSWEKPANEQYLPIIENLFLSPNNEPLSTFSIDVDTASYSNVRRFLKQGQWPPANAVRIEELVNYFHYDYPEPEDGRPFSVNLEAGPCPWNSEHRLVRIGLKGKEIDKSQRPPSNLVFLLDVSGSMRDSNKLPLVKTAMEMLVGEMTEDDRIAIVTYAGKAGLKLASTSGQDKTRIIDAIHELSAGGSTNGEAGIKLAYEQAVGHFIKDGANRVILCTDGDFNVGTSGNKELVTLIQEQAKSKVFLSVFGFGMGNLKDGKLEQIADKGNGQYGYIDDEKEARKLFVEEMVGTLYTIAKDVKIQVEFNPQQVGGYRLIGYENRMLAAADFNDDKKDAGEIGAGHTVTALYEIIPFDKKAAAKSVDELKYRKTVKRNGNDKVAQELLTVKLRYKQPDADESVKIDFTLTDDKPRNEMPSVDYEWAVSVAGFGLLLRNSQYRGEADFDLIRELAMGSKGDDESGYRREFLDLVYTAHAMHARQSGKPIPPRDSLPEDKARAKAAVKGKYQKLLKTIAMPTDEANYGPFTDFGYWAGNTWGNHENLPKGHWVYVAPNWYIWGKTSVQAATPQK